MPRSKIIDHQISGKQKLAVGRDHDRSLDSLTSPRDKRILNEINKNADCLWKEAVAKREAEKATQTPKPVVQKKRQLTDREHHKLKILKRKENRLLKEALELEAQGKKKPAMNRRYQRNQALKEINNLIKGTVYDTDV
jgi:hypothetical protein